MNNRGRQREIVWAGLLLGIGFGGFFDGIVLHQILQWHHMVSHVDRYPVTTVAGLESNTLADGLFHVATWICALAGVFLLWFASQRPGPALTTRVLLGLMLMGWGSFNIIEGVIDHLILQVHHVKENSENKLAWDLAFLAWGAAMLVGGWRIVRDTPGDDNPVNRISQPQHDSVSGT